MKKKCKNFIKLLFFVQTMMNNFQNVIIELFSHEILYEFKMLKTVNLLNNDQTRKRVENDNSFTMMKNEKNMLRKKTFDAISFAQTMQKIRYDSKHKELILKKKNKMFLKLHKEYTQSDLKNRKFDKQRINSISVFVKIKKLAYKLNISNIWKIHFVVSIIHLKFASEKKNFYKKKSVESESVETERNDEADIYEMKRIVAKRIVCIEKKKTSSIFEIQNKMNRMRQSS